MLSQEGLSKQQVLKAFIAECPELAAPTTWPAARAHDHLRRCPQCGCDRLMARGHRLVLDPRGVVFPKPVAALDCDDCGRLYAVDEIWNRRLELGSTPVAHLVTERGGGRAA
jgi:hypothetical protein